MSRESYYWLVDALELYKPVQWESGRLTIAHTVMSKRKLNKLVTDGLVNGWDDPRLYTLASLRRRGFTPESINAFVRELGVTTANTTVLPYRLEHYVRTHLNEIAPRLFVVLDPLLVNITNLAPAYVMSLKIPNKPKDDSMGERDAVFTQQIYIDRSDFREVDEDNYFRLAPGKSVGLLNVPFPIKATKINKDAAGKIVSIDAVYEDTGDFVKPKTYIQWIANSAAHNSPVNVQVRLINNLFIHANPSSAEEVPGGWLSDINPDSMQIVPGMVEPAILNMKKEDKFQGLRIGYFCVDTDSDIEKGDIVINRTVTLKEDSKKDK
jgi:glutaminyl-tRNA synthetase